MRCMGWTTVECSHVGKAHLSGTNEAHQLVEPASVLRCTEQHAHDLMLARVAEQVTPEERSGATSSPLRLVVGRSRPGLRLPVHDGVSEGTRDRRAMPEFRAGRDGAVRIRRTAILRHPLDVMPGRK
jgi:hypothetical protein